MIPRYSRQEMKEIWEPENKFRIWFSIEAHACDAMAELGVVPKKAAEATPLTTNIFAYSLKKKKAYLIPEYSVNAPATSSDSASGISKGVRLHSARPLIKKMKKAINVNGLLKINQLGRKPHTKPL